MIRAKAIAKMVESATETFVERVSDMMSGVDLHGFELVSHSKGATLCKLLKKFDREYGFQNPAVLRLELEGDTYISETMDMLWDGINGYEGKDPFARYAYGRISENYRRVYENSKGEDCDKAHLLCDAISGMTEQYLVSLHGELKALKR